MIEKQLVAVTIPIYKVQPDRIEIMSLEQCLKILNKHPIIFFCPEGMDVTYYLNVCKNKANITFETFKAPYFKDLKGYNKLMLSKEFYRRFINFKYILIYQLDAFVFKDDLKYWCEQGYDYIGAPVMKFENENVSDSNGISFLKNYNRVLEILRSVRLIRYKFRHIENGGFSLRKVSKCLKMLSLFKKKASKWNLNEDTFWLYVGNLLFFYFKFPKEEIALKFSFEKDPEKCFEITGSIPFGCHAYLKYNPKFWKEYIPSI